MGSKDGDKEYEKRINHNQVIIKSIARALAEQKVELVDGIYCLANLVIANMQSREVPKDEFLQLMSAVWDELEKACEDGTAKYLEM